MKLKIKVFQIARVVSFLENTDFKGLKSVNRSKVTNYLGQKLDEVAEGEKTILEDFKDDQEKKEKELKAYYEETVVVEGSNYLKPLNVIKAKIKELTSEEFEQEFSGNDAYALSVLYEAFGLDQEGGEEQ